MNKKNVKATVLAVDDQPQNLKVLASVLSEDYNLSFANSGINALKNIENLMPDLILLDIMMPDINGFDVCRQLKSNEKTKDIPVVFLTAKTDIEDIMKGFDFGAVDYITKPFNHKEIKVRVKTHIQLYLAQRKIQAMNESLLLSEKELKKNADRLDKANKERDKFFSVLAHDLRNPFQIIIGFAGMLKGEVGNKNDESANYYAEQIYDVSKNTYNLLQNLLQWANLKQGKGCFAPKKLNLSQLTQTCVALLEPAARQKEITLVQEADHDLEILADTQMLESVLRNLAGNAIKFTPKNGTVSISAHKQQDKVVLSVSDTGVGMSEDKIKTLFMIDKTSSEPGTDGEVGTGLGLLLCKEFVDLHKGEIMVKSKPGEGTRFTVLL